jgi:D-alanine-D-alanine ligase-like ATP-grasp enzyme
LKQLGYDVVEEGCGKTLYAHLLSEKPEVVFNLASAYTADKAELIPGVLELAGVHYTGSGILAQALCATYTKLFPLLSANGIRLPAFEILQAGAYRENQLNFPLQLMRDGLRSTCRLSDPAELERTACQLPAEEEILLFEDSAANRVSLYLLDQAPFLGTDSPIIVSLAQKAYEVIEARGLARFDFVDGAAPVLERIDIAPDLLADQFIRAAASAGMELNGVLQSLVQHAGSDGA